MENLLKIYYKRIFLIAFAIFVYNISILQQQVVALLLPFVIIFVISAIVNQSVNLELSLLKSLPINKAYISSKTVKLFIYSTLVSMAISLACAYILFNLGLLSSNIIMITMTLLLNLPIILIVFSLLLPYMLIPIRTGGSGFIVSLLVFMVACLVLFAVLALEGTLKQVLLLGTLALPLYIISYFTIKGAYNGILERLNCPLDAIDNF